MASQAQSDTDGLASTGGGNGGLAAVEDAAGICWSVGDAAIICASKLDPREQGVAAAAVASARASRGHDVRTRAKKQQL